jgi:hypothetical protein
VPPLIPLHTESQSIRWNNSSSSSSSSDSSEAHNETRLVNAGVFDGIASDRVLTSAAALSSTVPEEQQMLLFVTF